MKTTLYNLTKTEAKNLFNHFDNDSNKIALVLWNKGISESLESAIKKVIRLKNFIN